MADRFEPDKLHNELDVLVNYTDIERDLEKRFRTSYSPFTPAIHRPIGPDAIDQSSPMSTTSYLLKAHLPTAAPEEEHRTHGENAQYSSEEEPSLKASMLQGIRTIEKKEQVSRWQGSVGLDQPVSMTTGMVHDRERLIDLGEPEIATEKATSYSGSDDGECIQPTGDIEMANVSATEAHEAWSNNATDEMVDDEKPVLFKRERKTSPESPDGFVFKRRRSARLAALLANPE
ncbi:hypothetical protein BDV27DRAFT_153815 [Aspergillus caelatus]|uniref:Uncharacterized protein n=1 Tax=Aspergillus caelatus TaxID=61420 RepID=A0A5N7AFH8_9EURO|nr:uncharacterized protein BDV27DRAFT_153815 [Aspergillus caelatus]KAE8368617.1 hypothetical protein BDV27DRAFT_153815 [Aspergillus caelatus]